MMRGFHGESAAPANCTMNDLQKLSVLFGDTRFSGDELRYVPVYAKRLRATRATVAKPSPTAASCRSGAASLPSP